MITDESTRRFREGNYVDYRGNLGYFKTSIIRKIESKDDGSLFLYSLFHHEKGNFAGYANEVHLIALTIDHFKKLGFTKYTMDWKSIGLRN